MAEGSVTLHVLNGYHGRPAGGIRIQLSRMEQDEWQLVKDVRTNDRGRTDEPLLSPEEYRTGRYQVLLHVGDYFAEQGAETTDPPYLTTVPLHLNFAEPTGHYHVPVTISPWGYVHFRGSA